MSSRKVGLAAGAVATLGAAIAGGTAIADAASSNASASGTAATAYGLPWPGGGDDGGGYGGRGPGHDHTPVTGAELTKVTDAVEAADPDVTVRTVMQDPDGSYDVFGTRAGAPVMLEVSEDLESVTERTGGPGRGSGPHAGDGGPGAGHTPVNGAERADVTDAVERHDAEVTVESVRKDPDGSYDVFGTRAGAPVMLEVSEDLATVTEHAGGRHLGGHDREAQPSAPSSETGYLQS